MSMLIIPEQPEKMKLKSDRDCANAAHRVEIGNGAHHHQKKRLAVRFPGCASRASLSKLRRIKDAARELFIAKGFDDTTTREIAQRASVGIGTLFIYADNKRDLLFLVANDESLTGHHAAEQASIRYDVLSAAKPADDLPPARRVSFCPARAVADDAQGNDFDSIPGGRQNVFVSPAKASSGWSGRWSKWPPAAAP